MNGTVNLNAPGDDKHITGQIGGKDRKGPAKTLWEAPGKGAKKQEAMVRPTKLVLPAVRPRRIANEHGATSFHFAHEAISKTNHEKTTNRGTKNRKGAAKDHIAYIERDGALAKVHADDLSKIEKELEEIAKVNPELAERLGLEIPDAQENGEPGAVYLNRDGKIVKADSDDLLEILEDETIDPELAATLRLRIAPQAGNDNASEGEEKLTVGALASIYIEREEALAHDDNGTACLFTNISDNARERQDFWKEVEKRESDPGEDRMRIMLKGNRDFWDQVAKDDDCPRILRQAIEAADEEEEVVVRTGDNEQVRKLMAQYGWKPREKRPENETDEQKAAREEREVENSYGARFEDGRGGRVQFRIVGELPYDVDHEARVRILKGFSEEFEKRNLPYISVMHAPDHTNDDRNWHFHLVYHDRPVKRFTGDANDHMWDLPEDAGSKKTRQHEILQSTVGAPELEEHKGKWDFMVPWQYKKPVSRNIMTTYPFTQDKDREVTRRPFIPSLRKKLAELTNRELEAAQKDRRLDPRKYSEMGIHKAPDLHLGTQAARLESVGIPTEAGLTNERNQWNFIQDNLANKRAKTELEIERKIKSWNNGIAAGDLTDSQREKAEKEMIRWEQDARRASEHRAIALNLQEHYDRLKSRAVKLEKMADKHIKAIKEGRATKRQTDNFTRYEEKKREAQIHLHGLSLVMAEEIGQIASSEISADRYEKQADASAKIIDDIVSGGQALRREREGDGSAQRDPKKDNARAASGSEQKTENGLSRKDIDNYIARIVERQRRVVEKDGVIVPNKPTAKDVEIIASEGYERTQVRLGKLKEKQDEMIGELVAAIARNPRMVVAKGGEQANRPDASHSDRYNLATRNKRYQQVFRMFADEPEITKAIDDTIAKREAEARDRKTGRNAPANKPVQNKTETPVDHRTDEASKSERPVANSREENKPAPARDDAEARQRKDRIREVIEITREKHLRPTVTKSPAGLEVAFSRQDVALFRVPENLVIDDQRSISRMEGIIAKNDRGVKRLVAYLSKNPSAVREPTDSDPSELAKRAPKELRQLAIDHARDPQLRKAIEDATIKARLEKSDPRRQDVEPARTQTPKVTKDSDADQAPTAKDGRPANEPASRKPEEPVRKTETKNERVEPDNAVDDASTKTMKPETSRHVDAPARTEDEAIRKPARETGKTESEQSSEVKEDKPVEPAPEPRRQGTLRFGPGGRIIRDVTPTEVKDYGARKVSGNDEAAKAPDKDARGADKAGKEKRRAVIDDRQMDLLGERTYERVPTRKLEKGINVKLDAWIEAEEKKDLDARRKAAAAIRGDRHLLSIVDEMNPQVRARLQRDWDGIDDRNKRNARGLPDRNKNR